MLAGSIKLEVRMQSEEAISIAHTMVGRNERMYSMWIICGVHEQSRA